MPVSLGMIPEAYEEPTYQKRAFMQTDTINGHVQ